MDAEFISVIIPTFNRTKFLVDAIDSILKQTYSFVEILVINDGSDKETFNELEKIIKISNKIKLYSLPTHKGVASARNLGLDKAKGDYIFFLDDDDLIPNNLFEIAIKEFLINQDLSAVVFPYQYLNMPDYPYDNPVPMLNYSEMGIELAANPFAVILSCCPPVHSFFLRKKAITNERFPDLIIGEDWYFWLRLAYKGCIFKLNKQTTVYYRRHLENSTVEQNKFFKELMKVLIKVEENKMLRNREEKFLLIAKGFAISLRSENIRKTLIYLSQSLFYPDFAIRYLYKFISYRFKILASSKFKLVNISK
ncbi:MAG: glycosyltransferase family 2 protein [Blastocatellia bacterium]